MGCILNLWLLTFFRVSYTCVCVVSLLEFIFCNPRNLFPCVIFCERIKLIRMKFFPYLFFHKKARKVEIMQIRSLRAKSTTTHSHTYIKLIRNNTWSLYFCISSNVRTFMIILCKWKLQQKVAFKFHMQFSSESF